MSAPAMLSRTPMLFTRSLAPRIVQPLRKAVLSTCTNAVQAPPKIVPLVAAGVATAGLGLYSFASSSSFTKADSDDAPVIAEKTMMQKCIAEAVGTFMIVGGGCGIVAAMKYANSGIGLLGISTGFGMSVTAAIYSTAHISGAHLNPAVTISLIANNGEDPAVALPYIAAQSIGATLAGALVYLGFSDGIKAAEKAANVVRGGTGSAAVFEGAFGLMPNKALVRTPGSFVVEVAATACLLFIINAFTDPNGGVPEGAAPPLIGASVAALIGGIGPINGCCMNPARDYGPRLVSAMTGLGKASLHPGWWTYTAGPIVGALLGGALYHAIMK